MNSVPPTMIDKNASDDLVGYHVFVSFCKKRHTKEKIKNTKKALNCE